MHATYITSPCLCTCWIWPHLSWEPLAWGGGDGRASCAYTSRDPCFLAVNALPAFGLVLQVLSSCSRSLPQLLTHFRSFVDVFELDLSEGGWWSELLADWELEQVGTQSSQQGTAWPAAASSSCVEGPCARSLRGHPCDAAMGRPHQARSRVHSNTLAACRILS